MKLLSELRRRSTVFLGRNDSRDSQSSDSPDSSQSQFETTGTSSPEMVVSQRSSNPSSPPTSVNSMSREPSQLQLSTALNAQTPGVEALSTAKLDAQTAASSLPPGPQLTNVTNGLRVCYQVVLLEGNVPEALPQGGVLLLQYSTGKRPCTEWEVSHSKFKALAYLESGQNEIILEYATDEATEPCISKYTLTYHPMTSCPPVKLVILQAIGSKLAHEPSSVPGETFLSVAMAKFRMAAYLWQAYMGDRIDINNYGRRTFQLENLWKHSTLYSQDQETKEMRNEAPVYNIILDKSVDELKQLSETDMISCVERALMKRFKIQYGNQGYFACMFLDAEWDDTNKALMGAISYGGRGKLFASRLNLALFGAHLTFSYPSSINTVPQAFSNATATPGLPGITQGECASLGIGSHLKQVGHMLGLPNQADGIMGNEYTQFARAFSFQNNSKALEPQLHPLDIIRLRHHPLFQSPFIANDRDGVRYNTGIVIWGGCKSTISINSRAGITAIEILLSRDNVCNHWLDLLDSTGRPRSNFQLHLAEILKQVPSSRSLNRFLSHPGPFALRILTADGKSTPVMDFTHFATRLVSRIPGDKRKVSRSQLIGTPAPNSTHGSVILPQSVHLLAVKVYSTRRSVVGMEFVLTDETKLFGARTNDRPVEFEFAWGMGEMIMGLELRVKQHVCGLSFFTTLGRQSEWFGGALGIEYKLIPPATFGFVGLEGDFGESISSVQLITARH